MSQAGMERVIHFINPTALTDVRHGIYVGCTFGPQTGQAMNNRSLALTLNQDPLLDNYLTLLHTPPHPSDPSSVPF